MADSYNELFGLGSHSEDANLEGWWPLQDDAASTTVDDVSSNAINGTLSSGNTADASTTGPNSYLAKALTFSGSSEEITFSSAIVSSQPVTILGWFNSDTVTGNGAIMSIANSGDAEDYFELAPFGSIAGDPVGFVKRGPGGPFDAAESSSGFSINTWHHAAGSADASNSYAYIDGGNKGTEANSQSLSSPDRSSIGSLARSSKTDFFDGELAGVAVFSRVLTDAEVAEHYNGPEPVNSVAPALSGTETEGQTLSCTTGTWGLPSPFSGGTNGTINYAYQWTRSDNASGLNEADISGATSSTYTLTASDVGKYIRCRVRASNTGGADTSADTNSGFTGAIAASGGGANIQAIMHHRRMMMSCNT